MGSKKLIKGISSLAVLAGFVALGISSVEAGAEKLRPVRDYLVKLTDGSAQTRYAFQEHLIQELGAGNFTVKESFSGPLFEGFGVSFRSDFKSLVKAFPEVEKVYFNQVYALPKTMATSLEVGNGALAEGVTDSAKTTTSYSRATMRLQGEGIQAPAKQGEGITVGILDTGLFFNQVNQSETPSSDPLDTRAFQPLAAGVKTTHTRDTIEALKSNPSLQGKTGKYINSKVVWEYDYADDDNNVSPAYTGSHGTHVASLALANGNTYEGAAPDAQLAVLKVFADQSSGAGSSAILKAVQDAALLKLDVINLSLGSSLFQTANDENDSLIYDLMAALQKEGMQVNIAAGNDGRGSFNAGTGFFADTVTTDTVEPSEFGGYALLQSPNIVASSFLDMSYQKKIVGAQGRTTSFTEQNTDYPFATLFESSDSYDFSYIPNLGSDSDYEGLPGTEGVNSTFVNPTIAVVDRGTISFVEKATAAQKHGAKGLIVVNNVTTEDNLRFNLTTGASEPITIPVVSVPKSGGTAFLGPGQSGTVSFNNTGVLEANEQARQVSYFSSEGPATDLGLNPDITAPGTDILGAVNGTYETMSGTSMADPNFTGAMATILSNIPDAYTPEQRKEYIAHLTARLQSTATPLQDDSLLQVSAANKKNGKWTADATGADGRPKNSEQGYEDVDNFASPRRAGAGMINVQGALQNKIWLESWDGTSPASAPLGTGKAKLALGYTDEAVSRGDLSKISYIVHNESNAEQTYKIRLYVAVPEAREGILGSDIENMGGTLDDYARGQSTTKMMSMDDHMVAFDDLGTKTFPAGDTLFRLSDLGTGKGDYSANADLLDYVNEHYSAGTFLEGYVVMEPQGTTDASNGTALRIPYLGFFGDYGKADAVEKFDFQRKDDSTLNSDVAANIPHLIANGSRSADFGSQIYAASRKEHPEGEAQAAALSIATGASTLDDHGFAKLGTDTNGEVYDPSLDGVVAGVEGQSDLLIVKQFVNRSLVSGKVTLKDPSGNEVRSTWMQDYAYSDTNADGTPGSNLLQNEDGSFSLLKSFVTTSLIEGRIYSALATSAIPLYDAQGNLLKPGDYALSFDYVLVAKGADGKNLTQNRSVTVRIPQKASKPAIYSYGTVANQLVLFVPEEAKYVRFFKTETQKSVVNSALVYRESDTKSLRYVMVPTTHIDNGMVKGSVVGQDGQSYQFIVDVKGRGGYSISGADLSAVDVFYLTAVKKTGSVTFTVHASDRYGRDARNYFQKTHGATVALEPGLPIQGIVAFDKDGKLLQNLTEDDFSYDASTGQLSVLNLIAGAHSFSVTY